MVSIDEGLHRAQISERWNDHHLDALEVLIGESKGQVLHQMHGLEVVEVHLPIAGHQWLTTHQLAPFSSASSTEMPGSTRPSRYSRLAPPPVEMCPNDDSENPSDRTA